MTRSKRLLILSLCFPSLLFAANKEKLKAFKLIEPIKLTQGEEGVKAEYPGLSKSAQKVYVVGRQRASLVAGKTKIVQVVWTGLQNDKNQHAAFDKPLITVVQTTTDALPKDVELPFEGEITQLDVALTKLAAGQVNEDKEATAANPESDKRRVQKPDPQAKRRIGLKGPGDLDAGEDGGLAKGAGTGNGTQEGFSGSSQGTSLDKARTAGEGEEDAPGSRKGGAFAGSRAGGPLGRGPRSSEGVDAQFQPASLLGRKEKTGTPEPQTVVEVEECEVRIDEAQERVYVQNRPVTKVNGQITQRGPCKDSLKFFDLKRDYNGEGCADYVNGSERKAYDRYRLYWVDDKGERRYVGDRVYVEKEKPHPFIEEPGACSDYLDLEARTAHPQVETVYYGRGNKRVVVAGCHKDPLKSPLPITETSVGCEPLHNLTAGTSQERVRGIYMKGDVEHQAFSCRPVGDPLVHEFEVSAGCKPVKNLTTKRVTRLGRRFITLRDGTKHFLSSACEPFGPEMDLEFSREGCAGFQHDLALGKSFALGKWGYSFKGTFHPVTKCLVGPVSYAHKGEKRGYEHDDVEKLSYEKQRVWIETETGPVTVAPHHVRYDLPGIPYHFKEERVSESKDRPSRFEGCYQYTPLDTFKVFKRVDGTEYLAFLNTLPDRKSANLCQVRQEQERYREYLLDYQTGWRSYQSATFTYENKDYPFGDACHAFKLNVYGLTNSYVYYRLGRKSREVTTFPDGHTEESAWKLESDGPWIPVGDVEGRSLRYKGNKHAFPGAPTGFLNSNGTPEIKDGPNRVN